MLLHDTFNPLRTLEAVKRFVIRLGERGEVTTTTTGTTTNVNAVEDDTTDTSGGTEDWRTSLPDNVKAHPALTKYKTKDDAVVALVEAQSLIGAEKIIMPSKDADEKEWNERVFNRLGRPESADKYVLPTDMNIPKELPLDENMTKGFKETAHKIGLLPKQVEGLYRWYMEQNIAQYNNIIKGQGDSMKASETKLRTDYGAAYDQNIGLARKVVNKFASPEAVESLIGGKGNDPELIRMFVEIGKVLSEDQLAGKPKGLIMTPEEAKVELDKIKNDLKHPFYVENHPEHKAAVEKVLNLNRMAYPEGT